MLVNSNTFISNAGYFDSSVLLIRGRADNLYASLPVDGKMPCGGLEISDNYFEHNFGCTKVGGALIDLKCIDTTNTTSSSALKGRQILVDMTERS